MAILQGDPHLKSAPIIGINFHRQLGLGIGRSRMLWQHSIYIHTAVNLAQGNTDCKNSNRFSTYHQCYWRSLWRQTLVDINHIADIAENKVRKSSGHPFNSLLLSQIKTKTAMAVITSLVTREAWRQQKNWK